MKLEIEQDIVNLKALINEREKEFVKNKLYKLKFKNSSTARTIKLHGVIL